MYCWCLNSSCMFWLCQCFAYGYFCLLRVAKIADDNSLGFMEWFRSMCVVSRFLRVQSTKINLIAFVPAQVQFKTWLSQPNWRGKMLIGLLFTVGTYHFSLYWNLNWIAQASSVCRTGPEISQAQAFPLNSATVVSGQYCQKVGCKVKHKWERRDVHCLPVFEQGSTWWEGLVQFRWILVVPQWFSYLYFKPPSVVFFREGRMCYSAPQKLLIAMFMVLEGCQLCRVLGQGGSRDLR